MTTICQNVGTLTTTTVRTSSTIYVTTSIQQMAGRPITSTVFVPSATCRTAALGNSTTTMCSTSTGTSLVVVTPTGTQVQVPVTVTNQVFRTEINTLVGAVCRTVTAGGPPPTADAFTETTYTTEFYTVTGSGPSTTTSHLSTKTTGISRTGLSRSTVYSDGGPTPDPDASDVALASTQSGSSGAPVGAIVGGVLGGLVALLLIGFLVYYLLAKKRIAGKGYKAPGEGSPHTEQLDVFSAEQTGYQSQGYDGQGQGYPSGAQNQGGWQGYPQNQGFGGQSGPTQPQGSYPMQYSDMGSQGAPLLQPQGAPGGHMYPHPQGPQYMPQTEMGQVPFNTASGGAFPVGALAAGAALPVVTAASLNHRYSSSSSPPPGSSSGQYSPASHVSAMPLIHPSPGSHQQSTYRGYAEPADG